MRKDNEDKDTHWNEILIKGKPIDVTNLELFPCKKDTEDKNFIYSVSNNSFNVAFR